MSHRTSSQRLMDAVTRTRRQWQIRSGDVAALPTTGPAAFTIAISREAGARGLEVARLIGERLGWPVYDRGMLLPLVERLGVSAELLGSLDERRTGWLREAADAFLCAPGVSSEAYFRRLAELLLELAARGQCVLVGRGAAHILPPATTLRVRLVGTLADRIAHVAERLGVGREEAASWVADTDQERAGFVADHLGVDPADPLRFDLVLNTSRFSTDECAGLVIDALHRLQARDGTVGTTVAVRAPA